MGKPCSYRLFRAPARATALLFVLALAARGALLVVGPWADPNRAMSPDSARYVLLAEEVLTHGSFGKAEEDGLMHRAVARLREANGTLPPADANGLRPESFRTPGYPLFLALCLAAGGLRVALALQCLLGAALACLVRGIGLSLGMSARGAFVAGLLWAVHPALVLYDNQVLTESLFNVCTVGALFLAARLAAPAGPVGAGLLLGFAGLVRPLGLLYLPLVLAVLVTRPGRRLAAAAWVVVLAIVPSAAWACRNYAVGEGLRVSSVGDLNLLFYTAAYTTSEERHEDWLRSWPARVEELEARLGQRVRLGQDVVGEARRLALEEIRARPVPAAHVLAKAQLKLLVDHSLEPAAAALGVPYVPSGLFSRLVLGDRSAEGSASLAMVGVALGWAALNALIAAGAAAGAVLAFRRRSFLLPLALALTVVLFALATNSVGLERFRLPMMLPLLLLFGGLFGPRGGPESPWPTPACAALD